MLLYKKREGILLNLDISMQECLHDLVGGEGGRGGEGAREGAERMEGRGREGRERRREGEGRWRRYGNIEGL